MKEPDLHKYFSGDFSDEEKLHLKHYLESRPDYYTVFLRERKLYNLGLFSRAGPEGASNKVKPKSPKIKQLFWSFFRAAVIFLLAMLCFQLMDKDENKGSKAVAYQTITVPFGQRVNLNLPDGSKVWLNAGTTIRYPVSFNERERLVFLDGEAFFDIAKNDGIPFRVTAGNHEVEVLGTQFNIKVDIGDRVFETALFEGSVKVIESTQPSRPVHLTPNTLLSLVGGELLVSPITDPDKYDWKKGLLSFHKEEFGNVMAAFERAYGCQIIVRNNNVNKYLYTGKFIQSDGIDYALNLLRESIRFTYSRDKKTNTIIIR